MKNFFLHTVLILLALSMAIPFFMMFLISLSGNENIFTDYKNINLSLLSYKNVFSSIPVIRYFLNSLVVAALTTAGQIVIAALAGYGFARLEFRGRDFLFFIIVLTMMVPPQVNIVPLFFIMSKLGWINTYQALIVPGIFGGLGVFMMRQWFRGLSQEIEDAAKIDGCNTFQLFFKIAMPLALPAVVTLGLFTFVTTWNSFMWPLIVTHSPDITTLPVALAQFKGSFREIVMWGDLMACSVVLSLPAIVVFLLGKKYFINDMLSGGLKE